MVSRAGPGAGGSVVGRGELGRLGVLARDAAQDAADQAEAALAELPAARPDVVLLDTRGRPGASRAESASGPGFCRVFGLPVRVRARPMAVALRGRVRAVKQPAGARGTLIADL